jgi:hypothetical protein
MLTLVLLVASAAAMEMSLAAEEMAELQQVLLGAGSAMELL